MSNPNDFQKPKLPTPVIPEHYQRLTTPHFSTPAGMLLKGSLQPPPMYGLRGSTIAPKFLPKAAPTYKELAVDHPYRKPQQPKEIPQNTAFCDFCDRSYRTSEQLDKHKMQSHRELMGIKPRVYTAEEINEWKDARKKRYPTTKNILARQQANEERRKRGERLQDSKARFGKREDRRQMPQNHQKRDNNWQDRKKKYPPSKKFVPEVEIKLVTDDSDEKSVNNGLCMFRGTSSLTNYEGTQVLKHTNALLSLGSYGSSTESEPEEVFEPQTKVSKLPSKEDEGPVEAPIVKIDPFTDAEIASTPNHEPPQSSNNENSSKKRHRKRKHSKDGTVPQENPVGEPEKRPMPSKRPPVTRQPWFNRYRRYQNTMLEKLLQPEIRHERNVLLQCVRYVVENNFFGIGSDSKNDKNVN